MSESRDREPEENPNWYAVHVRSNQEMNTAAFLADRDVTHFLPTYRVRSRRRDRAVTLVKPLFTGYLFVKLEPHSSKRIQVLKAPGTVRIVGFGGSLTPIPDSTIESLKILVGEGGDVIRPHPLVRVGSRVRVTSGAFRGALGTLHETSDKSPRLVVEIEFLGRAVAVPISKEQVQPEFE